MKEPEGDKRASDTLMVKPDPNSPVNRRKAQIMRERAQERRGRCRLEWDGGHFDYLPVLLQSSLLRSPLLAA